MKYLIKYSYLDETGDYSFTDEDIETFSSIKELADWAVKNKHGHSNFQILSIKKINDLSKNETWDYIKAFDIAEGLYQEKIKKEQERLKQMEEERKLESKKNRYNLYLRLEKEFGNKKKDTK